MPGEREGVGASGRLLLSPLRGETVPRCCGPLESHVVCLAGPREPQTVAESPFAFGQYVENSRVQHRCHLDAQAPCSVTTEREGKPPSQSWACGARGDRP